MFEHILYFLFAFVLLNSNIKVFIFNPNFCAYIFDCILSVWSVYSLTMANSTVSKLSYIATSKRKISFITKFDHPTGENYIIVNITNITLTDYCDEINVHTDGLQNIAASRSSKNHIIIFLKTVDVTTQFFKNHSFIQSQKKIFKLLI